MVVQQCITATPQSQQ